MLNRRRFTLAAVATAAGPRALAQEPAGTWPTRTVRMVVGFPAGSTPDLIARTLSEPLGKALGQTIVVDNKVGASGNIAADQVAKATDDHTLGIVINGTLTTAKALYKGLAFDPTRDFCLLSLLATSPLLLVVPPDLPDGAAFLETAMKSGGTWNYGSVGTGSTGHLGMAYLMTKVPGLKAVHVPFQGNPQVITALLGGQIQMALVPPAVAIAHVKAGKLKAIGVAGPASALVPGIPSLSEAGIKDFDFEVWMALVGPARLPSTAQSRLAAEAMKIMQSDDTRQRLFAQGFTAVGSTPAAFEARVKHETAVMADLIRAQGISLD